MNWIDTSEKLPNEFDRVLFSDGQIQYVGFLQKYENYRGVMGNIWWASNANELSLKHCHYLVENTPKYWMPLPNFPQKQDN